MISRHVRHKSGSTVIEAISDLRRRGSSDVDNDAYYICTHDFSLCSHKKFRPVRTMYAVIISGTQTIFGFMRTQIKLYLKLSQNDNFSTNLSGCSVNNRKVVTILMQLLIVPYYISSNILCIFSSYTIYVLSVQCLFTKNLFMKLNGGVAIWFIKQVFCINFWSLFIMFSSFFLSYYLCKGQTYGLTCLNDRITCNYGIINQFT